jgi:hypothetical protein
MSEKEHQWQTIAQPPSPLNSRTVLEMETMTDQRPSAKTLKLLG